MFGADIRDDGGPSPRAYVGVPAIDGEGAGGGSRRLSGAAWQPALAIPHGEFAGTAALPMPVRRSRRRHRAWYRKPVVLAPVLLVVLIAGLAAGALLRAEATIAELRAVSTPPPSVTLRDDDTAPAVEVDTAPARAALQTAQTMNGAPPDEGGSLFGDFKDKAGSIGDVAGGAAAAAGLTDPTAGTMTVLLLGVDARPGAPIDIAVKADAIVVLHLNPDTKSCRILSIPRDTRAELPGYGPSKVNHALMVGGIPYQQLVVAQLLGITIDHYALIDFAGFQELVDAVGGVTVTVPEAITQKQLATQGRETGGPVVFGAGPQVFTGEEALAYARYRGGPEGDLDRIKRQWAVMRGLLAAADGRDLVRDVNRLLPAVENHIRTDLDARQMAAIAKTFGGSCDEQTMGTGVLAGTRVRLADPLLKQTVYYNVVDPPVIRQRVEELLAG
jgi:LCP family protein required for cell wall assembly